MNKDLHTFGLDKDELNQLIAQFDDERVNSDTFMKPKWEKWRKRLKLLNNQKRNAQDIGEPLAHVHFDTILAALYDDEINVTFLPRSQGDVGVTESLNPLYAYDCDIMDKNKIKYNQLWNTLFFGRSLLMMYEFDRENMCPKPEVVNMLTWHRDPNALSVNGDSSGRGAMRFGGRPIALTKKQMEDAGVYKNLHMVQESYGEDRVFQQAKDEIRNAQGFSSSVTQEVIGENREYIIYEWFTFHKGKRVVIGMANGGRTLVRYNVLKDQDQWGIIDQTLFQSPLSWDGISVLDLVEDKQRAIARIINAALFNVEANSNHMYAYDATRIMNESDLDFENNKHIAVNGQVSGAIQPITRSQVYNEVQFMLGYLDTSAQKATSASAIQQGAISGAKRSATEIANVSEGTDTRFNLMSKVISWSEKAFAEYWYKMYKMYFKNNIDEKIMRIVGANGVFFKPFTRENLIAQKDPDVTVKSKIVGEGKRLRELQEFNSMFEILMNDPTVNKEQLFRKRAKLAGLSEMEMMRLFKQSPEEILARDENELLNKGKTVKINETDDDLVHILEHQKAAQNKTTIAHIEDHYAMYIAKNKNPNLKQEVQDLGQLREQPIENTPKLSYQAQNFDAAKTLQTANT